MAERDRGLVEKLEVMASPTEDHPPIGIDDINDESKKKKLNTDIVERESGGGEREMGHSIHRSGSRPQLDLSKAAIQGNFEEKDPTILLPNQSDDISHLALDIGGELSFCELCNSFDLVVKFFFFFILLLSCGTV